MKKKTLLFVLVLLSTLTASAYDAQIDGIYYNFISKSKIAEVTGDGMNEYYYMNYYNHAYSGDVVIPETVSYNGVTYNVTSIGEKAFYYCKDVTSITIPKSIKSIGSNAFINCIGLNSIYITDLAVWCDIKFSNSSNPMEHAQHFFVDGTEMKDIIIPNNVTAINSYAFYGFSNMTSITIPNSVTTIGEYAFSKCSNLTSIIIPNSVTEIGNHVFDSCSGLTSVTIPNSVTTIGDYAFSGCTGLTSLTIPNSVTTIGDYAISACTGLTSITIPNRVVSIGSGAFSGCTGLTNISIPNSVTYLGSQAFANCANIKSITIPNKVTSINYGVFQGCSGLTAISIPDNVSSIGWNAFENCSGLTSISFGKNISSISLGNFKYCPELADVYCYGENVPSVNDDIFIGSYIEYATLHVPATSISAYRAAEPWSGFGTIKTLSGESPVIPKCATPTINYVDGKVTFSCETEGVEFVTKVASSDSGDYEGTSVSFTNQYTVSVYATKEGYDDSDVATKEISVVIGGSAVGIKGDVNADGIVNGTDIQEVINIIVNGPEEEEQLSLSCPNGNHPHMIDLGLPSGTKWACCNVGASKPENFGNYYAWGEVEPKSQYDFDTYIGFSYDELISGNVDTYGTEKDVAHVQWGDKWRIPTYSEVCELRDNCTYTEITYNGIKGMKFIGKNGNTIFLPAAGRYEGDQLIDNGVTGHYWQGCVNNDETQQQPLPYYDGNYPWCGLTIRPVYANSTTR